MKHRINFLPWRDGALHTLKRRLAVLFVSVVVIFILVQCITYRYFTLRSTDINDVLIELELTIRSLDNQLKYQSILQDETLQLSHKIDEFSSIERDKHNTLDILKLLPALIPDDLFLQNLTKNNDLIRISGLSRNMGLIDTLINKIKSHSWLSQLEIHSISTQGDEPGWHHFSMSFRLNNQFQLNLHKTEIKQDTCPAKGMACE